MVWCVWFLCHLNLLIQVQQWPLLMGRSSRQPHRRSDNCNNKCVRNILFQRGYIFTQGTSKNIAALQPLVGHDRSDLISYDLLPFGLHSEAAQEGWSKMYHKNCHLSTFVISLCNKIRLVLQIQFHREKISPIQCHNSKFFTEFVVTCLAHSGTPARLRQKHGATCDVTWREIQMNEVCSPWPFLGLGGRDLDQISVAPIVWEF